MKAYVVNPRRKKKNSPRRKARAVAKRRRRVRAAVRRVNPLPALIVGANPSKRRSHVTRKRKNRRKKYSFGARALAANQRRRNPPHRHHHRRSNSRRNPLPIPMHDAPAMVVGAVGGGILSSYAPNYLLGSSDTGVIGYAANAAVAIGGAWALARWKNFSTGWLLGGLTMTVGRMFDDYFGKQIVTFNMPVTPATASPAAPATPLSSYYRSRSYSLPAASPFAAQPQIAAAPVVTAPAATTTNPRLSTVRTSGMGWARNFRAA